MAGIVSNLLQMGYVLLLVTQSASVPAWTAPAPEAGSDAGAVVPAADAAPSADAASAPSPDTVPAPGTPPAPVAPSGSDPAASSDPVPVDSDTSPPQDGAPATVSPPPESAPQGNPPADPAPSSTLPTDAISSAANPPDDAPATDAPVPPPTRAPAPDISVTDSRLLSVQIDDAGARTVTPATAMPYVVGRSCYSWSLTYAPVDGDLTLTEELILPGPARNWGSVRSGPTVVNPQGSGAVTERHFDASTGTATAGWCVASSDPVGSYRYIIRQGDRELARFDFTVGDLL